MRERDQSRVELMVVEDIFDLSGLGLTLAPLFEVPPRWANRDEDVTVVRPDGTAFSARAKFEVTHFRLAEASRLKSPWQIVIRLPAETKATVPIGSRILVDVAAKDALAS